MQEGKLLKKEEILNIKVEISEDLKMVPKTNQKSTKGNSLM